MVILNIACLNGDKASGTNVIIPSRVLYQQQLGHISGLLNIRTYKIPRISLEYSYDNNFEFSKLEKPFDKPDIIVFHEVYYLEYIFIIKKISKLNIPYVIVPHGCLTKTAQKKKFLKKKIANFLLFNKFIKNAEALQLLSENESNNTIINKNKFISTNAIILPNEKKNIFNLEKLNIVYIGRLDIKIKGLDILLRSIIQIKEILREKKCFFTLYGPHNKQSKRILNLIKKYDISDIIIIKNAVYNEEKVKVLLESDLFIQASRSEGMPIGILEALSFGIPCIVTKGTGLSSFINEYEAGWTADCNFHSLSQAILNAIDNKEKIHVYSKNAVKLIDEQFYWCNTEGDAINKYYEIIDMRKE